MGRKNDYKALERMLAMWINRATQPSPYETMLSGELNSINTFLDSKDYRNLPKGVNIDMLPLADYRRQMSYMSPRGQGTTAAGADTTRADSNLQSLANEQLTRDWGRAYEEKVAGLQDRKYGLIDSLQGNHTNRMNAGIMGTQAQMQALLNRPRGFNWMGLLGMGAQALPGILAAI